MPLEVLTSEPSSFHAGETVLWTKTLSDFLAPTYTLRYAFQVSADVLLTVSASASGTAHAVTLTATATALWTPGAVPWTSYVDGPSSTRYAVARGIVGVLPSLVATAPTSHASAMLTLIEAALIGRIPRGLETTSIDGQSLQRIPIAELHRLRDKYRAEVQSERAAARLAAGRSSGRRHLIRFVR